MTGRDGEARRQTPFPSGWQRRDAGHPSLCGEALPWPPTRSRRAFQTTAPLKTSLGPFPNAERACDTLSRHARTGPALSGTRRRLSALPHGCPRQGGRARGAPVSSATGRSCQQSRRVHADDAQTRVHGVIRPPACAGAQDAGGSGRGERAGGVTGPQTGYGEPPTGTLQ